MERPDRPGVEVVSVNVGEQHQPQLFHVRLDFGKRDAAVDQDIFVQDHGISLTSGGDHIKGH